MDDRYLHLRLRESLRDKSVQECCIVTEDGETLGTLPATRVTTIVDYSVGHPVVRIEMIGERVDVETHRPLLRRREATA